MLIWIQSHSKLRKICKYLFYTEENKTKKKNQKKKPHKQTNKKPSDQE